MSKNFDVVWNILNLWSVLDTSWDYYRRRNNTRKSYQDTYYYDDNQQGVTELFCGLLLLHRADKIEFCFWYFVRNLGYLGTRGICLCKGIQQKMNLQSWNTQSLILDRNLFVVTAKNVTRNFVKLIEVHSKKQILTTSKN